MESEHTVSVFTELFASPAQLANGSAVLQARVQQDPGFIIEAAKAFINPNYDTAFRKHMGATLKSLIIENWDILAGLKQRKNVGIPPAINHKI